MFIRLFFYLLGYAMAVSGGVSIIAYLNLLPLGNGMSDYLEFIVKQPELYLFSTGIIMFTASIFFPKPSDK